METLRFKKETPVGNFEIEILGVNFPKDHDKQIEAIINGKKYNFDFVSRNGKNGMRISRFDTEILGKKINQDVLFTLPADIESKITAEFASIKTARENTEKKHYENLLSGKENFSVDWQEGDPLSGWVAKDDQARKILENLGLTEDISGWGTIVDEYFIQAVGQDFKYQQAFEYTQPKREEKRRKDRVKEEKTKKAFIEAKETGKPVEIRHYTVDCDNPNEECSTDIIVEWAYPDGTKEITKNHTW